MIASKVLKHTNYVTGLFFGKKIYIYQTSFTIMKVPPYQMSYHDYYLWEKTAVTNSVQLMLLLWGEEKDLHNQSKRKIVVAMVQILADDPQNHNLNMVHDDDLVLAVVLLVVGVVHL